MFKTSVILVGEEIDCIVGSRHTLPCVLLTLLQLQTMYICASVCLCASVQRMSRHGSCVCALSMHSVHLSVITSISLKADWLQNTLSLRKGPFSSFECSDLQELLKELGISCRYKTYTWIYHCAAINVRYGMDGSAQSRTDDMRWKYPGGGMLITPLVLIMLWWGYSFITQLNFSMKRFWMTKHGFKLIVFSNWQKPDNLNIWQLQYYSHFWNENISVKQSPVCDTMLSLWTNLKQRWTMIYSALYVCAQAIVKKSINCAAESLTVEESDQRPV